MWTSLSDSENKLKRNQTYIISTNLFMSFGVSFLIVNVVIFLTILILCVMLYVILECDWNKPNFYQTNYKFEIIHTFSFHAMIKLFVF